MDELIMQLAAIVRKTKGLLADEQETLAKAEAYLDACGEGDDG